MKGLFIILTLFTAYVSANDDLSNRYLQCEISNPLDSRHFFGVGFDDEQSVSVWWVTPNGTEDGIPYYKDPTEFRYSTDLHFIDVEEKGNWSSEWSSAFVINRTNLKLVITKGRLLNQCELVTKEKMFDTLIQNATEIGKDIEDQKSKRQL